MSHCQVVLYLRDIRYRVTVTQSSWELEFSWAWKISNALKTVTRNLQADFTIVSRGCLAPMWPNDSGGSRWSRDDSRESRWSSDTSVLSDARVQQTLHVRNTWRANPGPRGPITWVLSSEWGQAGKSIGVCSHEMLLVVMAMDHSLNTFILQNRVANTALSNQ